MTEVYRYDSYKTIDKALKNHERFHHVVGKTPDRKHFSVLEDGHYKVYTRFDGESILLLDVKGDRVIHIDRTFYQDNERLVGTSPVRRLQRLIFKHYGKKGELVWAKTIRK